MISSREIVSMPRAFDGPYAMGTSQDGSLGKAAEGGARSIPAIIGSTHVGDLPSPLQQWRVGGDVALGASRDRLGDPASDSSQLLTRPEWTFRAASDS